MAEYKCVIFDVDTTMIRGKYNPSPWFDINSSIEVNHAGYAKAIDDWYHEFSQQMSTEKYGFFARELKNIIERYGMRKRDFRDAFGATILLKGARETFIALRERKISLGIASGSFTELLSYHVPDYKTFFDYVSINEMDFSKKNVPIIRLTPYAMDKEDVVMAMSGLWNLDPKNIVFLGDGENDVSAAKIVGLPIAINPSSPELEKICSERGKVIYTNDMRDILPFIIT